jgi:hypothetical protein
MRIAHVRAALADVYIHGALARELLPREGTPDDRLTSIREALA